MTCSNDSGRPPSAVTYRPHSWSFGGSIYFHCVLLILVALLSGCGEEDAPTQTSTPTEEGYFTGADGNSLFYRKLGAGQTTVVYLHGGPINMNDGGYEIDRLASGRTLLMFDQRSGGRSELVEDARLQFDLFVADVEALRLHFGLEKMILVGQSFGADVVSNYAVQHPERVSRLMLWSPAPPTAEFAAARDAATRAFLGKTDARRADRIFYVLMPLAPDSEVVTLCREWVQLTFRFYLSDPTALSRMHGDYCAGSPAAIRHQFRAISLVYPSLGAFDFRLGLRTLQMPTLVVEGALTRVPLDATEEWVRAIPDARLLLVPGASHLLWLEGGEPFFQAAESFLSGQWPAAAVVLSPQDV
jgi:proline iminopeptidase